MGLALTPRQIEDTRAAMKRHDGNIAAVARELGIARSTAQGRVAAVMREPVSEPPHNPEVSAPAVKPRFRVPYAKGVGSPDTLSDEPIYKVLAIGDHHDKPGRDKTRALWIGRHATETRPDAIVSIGDWASLDSLSSHEKPGSQNDHERPAFFEELESLDESLSLFTREIREMGCPIIHTHGNHEHRAVRAGNLNPKISGDLPYRLDEVFSRYEIQTRPFGEFVDIFGVDFVHCPLNVMGREMGGENVERNIGNKSLRSVVFGHTHRANVLNISKVGQQRKVTILNLGTSMPMGVVEKYNGLSQTGWSYGVFELRIQTGVILSAKMFDMLELEERYGD